MEKSFSVNNLELKECVARAVGRVLKEELSKGEVLTEGFMDKVKAAAMKYGIPAALGIAAMILNNEYGMSEEEVEKIEADMRENPDKYFGATYENGGLDYDLQDPDTGLIKNPNYRKGNVAP